MVCSAGFYLIACPVLCAFPPHHLPIVHAVFTQEPKAQTELLCFYLYFKLQVSEGHGAALRQNALAQDNLVCQHAHMIVIMNKQ